MRVGMAQMLVEGGRAEANMLRAKRMIADAALNKCDVVVLPECFDLGWTDASASSLAQTIPGQRTHQLSAMAAKYSVVVVAGLTEVENGKVFNSAVVVDNTGEIRGKHRKIEEIDAARTVYFTGQMETVVDTSIGRLGVLICADNLTDRHAITAASHGAEIVLSPSSWAVEADHDESHVPYGQEWLVPYTAFVSKTGVPIVGVSNVGFITSGPWQGRLCIGKSLAVGRDGEVAARGPYGVSAETFLVAEV